MATEFNLPKAKSPLCCVWLLTFVLLDRGLPARAEDFSFCSVLTPAFLLPVFPQPQRAAKTPPILLPRVAIDLVVQLSKYPSRGPRGLLQVQAGRPFRFFRKARCGRGAVRRGRVRSWTRAVTTSARRAEMFWPRAPCRW